MSLKRQTLWSMAPLLVVTIINLVSIPLFYRFLGAEMYALWFYVLSLSGAFGFADLGLGVATGRYVGVELGRGDTEAARSYWASGNAVAIPLLLLMAALFAVIGAVYGPRWFNVAPEKMSILRWSFIAAGPGLFFSFYGQFWNILAQVHLDFKFISLLRVVLSVVQIGGAILLAAWRGNAFVLVVWGTLIAAVQLVILIFHAFSKFRFGVHWNLARLRRVREMASYTTKTFLTLVVNNILAGIDKLALGKLAQPVDFARYSICSNAGARVSGLSAAIMGPIFGQGSRAVGAGGEKTAEIYEEAFDFLFGWLVLISVWLTVWRHPILHLWLGPSLGSAVEPILPPIIIAYCITSISNISGAYLGPLDRMGAGLIIHIFAGILTVLCVYIGWRWGGVVGVAYGFLISRFAFLFQDVFVIRLTQARGWFDLKRWLHLCVQAAIGFALCIFAESNNLSFTLQITLAIAHGAVIATWLARKDIAAGLALISADRPVRQ